MATPQQLAALHAVVAAAQSGRARWGVPASVTLAQWTLESGWSSTGLAKQCNNFFGIKAEHLNDPSTYQEFKTHEFIHGVDTIVTAKFERYASAAEGFEDHARLLASASRYAPAMAACHDVAEFCHQLQVCGYSTSPTYATSLLGIVHEYNLTQYDTLPPASAAVAQEAA